MRTAELADILPVSTVWRNDELTIGGCSLTHLAEQFGTPLYVYDDATLRAHARRLHEAFAHMGARVSFAAKACGVLGVLRVFREEGLELDVVSGGEIEAALRAGFAPFKLHVHGNCKSADELRTAVQLDVHAVVIDNREELSRLAALTEAMRKSLRCMLRIRLRLEGETHQHLQTGGMHSKFGVPLDDIGEFLEIIEHTPALHLIGLHAHVGSQLTAPEMYGRTARELMHLAARLRDLGQPIEEISVGGGWAAPYRPGDAFITADDVAASVTGVFSGQEWVRPAVEPGRSLVARSAVAVYRVGAIKPSPAGRLVAVDGGMGDNPRPALYGARYYAMKCTGGRDPVAGPAIVVGRYCESGDVLARDVQLPEITAGDLVVVPASGAYQLAMASTYNLVPLPATVLVRSGEARLLQRRGTVDDLLLRDIDPDAEPLPTER